MALAVAFVAVAAVGSVVVLQDTSWESPATLTGKHPDRAPIAPTTTPRETLTPQAAISPDAIPEPVPARCWVTRKAVEDKGCQVIVKDRTKFIPRYQTNQSSLAIRHPVVKLANTGRAANSLARHGLLICWMVAQPSWSLDDMRSAFYLWFHRHPFTVPNDDTVAAADNVLSIAVQEICPRLAGGFEHKGGPKAELIQGG